MQHKIRIKIHINESCNLNCANCYSSKGNCNIPLTKVYNLIDECKLLGMPKLDILGGEPLLRKDVFDMVYYAKHAGMGVTLFTNATLTSKYIIKDLKDNGLDTVIVTLHSHKKEVHNAMTKTSNSLKLAIRGIKDFVSAEIKTYTNTPVNSQNFDHINGINEFVKSLGAKALFIKNIPLNKNDPLMIKDANKWHEFVEWLFYKKSDKCKNFLLRDLKKAREKGYVCPAFYNMLSIDVKGDVTVCPFSDFKIGNIYSSSLTDMIKKESKCDSQLNKTFFKIPDECKKCSIATICRGGCKAYVKNVCGSYSKKDPLCGGPWKKRISFDEIGRYIPYH